MQTRYHSRNKVIYASLTKDIHYHFNPYIYTHIHSLSLSLSLSFICFFSRISHSNLSALRFTSSKEDFSFFVSYLHVLREQRRAFTGLRLTQLPDEIAVLFVVDDEKKKNPW